MPVPKHAKVVDNKLIYDGDKGEVLYYIPEKLFDLNDAAIIGEYVETLGAIMYCEIDDSGHAGNLRPFFCPTMIKCKPGKIEKINRLTIHNKTTDYRVLHFTNGDELISELYVPMVSSNVQAFVDLFRGGNLPSFIPYDKIQDYISDNAVMNDFKYNISTQILGLLISEIYRDPDDLSKPFRLAKNKNMYEYTPLSINNVPKYISSYTAITSEYPDMAIASAIVNKGTKDTHSPLEKIMMN